jgi:hypothetical protein
MNRNKIRMQHEELESEQLNFYLFFLNVLLTFRNTINVKRQTC